MKRHAVRALLVAVVAAGALLILPFPGSAQSYQSTCPAMTDSITRLYLAYFDRYPDTNGFRHWVEQYQTGETSLAEISDTLARSNEFGDKRSLSNRTFVNWVYETVVGPVADNDRKDYWVQALDGGYPRGSMMLAFTESREFVEKTGTAVPLAGYLRWYPKGTHWYCDIGTVSRSVDPLVGDQVWADYYFHNRSDQPDAVELWTMEGQSKLHVNMVTNTLGPGFTDYNWDGHFSGDGDYGHSIHVKAGASTDWIVVFYPHSLGDDRLGWQIS